MTGVPLAAVAKYAGHSTIQMTMRYTHLIPNMHDQASEKMMSIYRSPEQAARVIAGERKVSRNTQVQRATQRATGTREAQNDAVNY
jgi:acyl-CoA synthetase (NDP forming)